MYVIPNEVMHSDCTSSSKLIFAAIGANIKEGYCCLSVEKLGVIAGVRRLTADASIKELQQKGFIKAELDTSTKAKKYKYEVLI
jgi:DNA-binding transcriptional regulator YhcF (GntR family)